MPPDRRSLIFRQAGLAETGDRSLRCASSRIGIIDGAADLTHPALQDTPIQRIGGSRSVSAENHATFCASIIVAREADWKLGRALAICPRCTVFNFAVVTDEMLAGSLSIHHTASMLAKAVERAIQANCQTILFGVEIRQPDAHAWQPLRESIRAALSAGSVVILPAGNRWDGVPDALRCAWPEALIAASRDCRGNLSGFSPMALRGGRAISAPGDDIPGAGPDGGYLVQSGTSFSAAIAAGALGLAACLYPGRSGNDLAAALFRLPHRILDGAPLFHDQLGRRGEPT